MKTENIKTLTLLLILMNFGKLHAQSDLLSYNSVNSVAATGEVLASYKADEKFRISDFMPNPANANSSVSVSVDVPVQVKVKFFSMNGDLVREEAFNLDKGQSNLSVDAAGLEKGIYMVQFYSKEGSAVRRFMKLD